MKDFHFDAISAFENYEIEQMRLFVNCSGLKKS